MSELVVRVGYGRWEASRVVVPHLGGRKVEAATGDERTRSVLEGGRACAGLCVGGWAPVVLQCGVQRSGVRCAELYASDLMKARQSLGL